MKNILKYFFIIFILNIFCTNNIIKKEKKELYVIFLQSDLNENSKTDIKKFDLIWNRFIPNLFAKIIENKNSEIWIYPLNAQTSTSNSLLDFKLSDYDGLMIYDRNERVREILDQAKNDHIAILTENNQQQDIIGSLILLDRKKTDFSPKTIIIYISDLVHYNTTIDKTDCENGLFNFEYPYSLDCFSDNIEDGFLYGNNTQKIEIPYLVGDAESYSLRIYSLEVPCEGKNISTLSLIKIPKVWKSLFEKIGGEKIELNLNSCDKIFENKL